MDETGVQTLYSEQDLVSILWTKTLQGMSLRDISSEYKGITHADIQRGLKGIFPRSPRKRLSFGLVALGEIEVCNDCGKAHRHDGPCPETVKIVEVVYRIAKEGEVTGDTVVIVKPIRPNGHSKPRTPPIRVGELTNEEREFVMALTPEERKERLTLGMWI